LPLLASWVLFPLLLAAIGGGWGVAVERAAGLRDSGVLVVPLGLAAAIVVASLLTAWSVTAPAAASSSRARFGAWRRGRPSWR
jgi:hypothetical protein